MTCSVRSPPRPEWAVPPLPLGCILLIRLDLPFGGQLRLLAREGAPWLSQPQIPFESASGQRRAPAGQSRDRPETFLTHPGAGVWLAAVGSQARGSAFPAIGVSRSRCSAHRFGDVSE